MRLNAVEHECTDLEYPLSKADLLAEMGDESLELQNGEQPLSHAIEVAGDEQFASAAEVREAVLTGVGHDAIGRRFYSDRDAITGEYGPSQISF